MKKLHFTKSFISLAVMLAMLVTLVPTVSFGAEADSEKVYAEITFGQKITATGKSQISTGMTPISRAGKYGLYADNTSDSNRFIYVDIDDSVLYEIPDETPVNITVEYFDEGNGFFSITYDSHNPSKGWGGQWDEILRSAERVDLHNTKEWKTHTFYIEDLRAANRVHGDFRIALWTKEYGLSSDEVIFGSVKVTEARFQNPVSISIQTENLGGLYNADEEIVLDVNLRNKSTDSISCKVSSKVYDSKGQCVQELLKDYTCELGEREDKHEPITITNPKVNGLYRVESTVDVWYTDDPENKVTTDLEAKFSVSYTFTKEELDPSLVIHHEISEPYGTPEAVAETLVKAGAGFYRDDGLKSELVDGTYRASEYNKEIFRLLKEHGIDVIQILYSDPSRSWNDFPETDEEIATYAKWVGDIAADLKGIVKYFEIYNEANLTSFNKKNTSPEIYAKICKAAYQAIKKANPEAVVMGICTAAYDGLSIDYKWTKRAFDAGAYDYLDIISLHPYSCWSGIFDEEKWIYSANVLRELMSQYGEIKPIWMTEYGFSTWDGKTGYTRDASSKNHILSRALNEAYHLYDNYCFFSLCDRTIRTEIEHNWGMLNYWEDPESTPYSAKESFVAMNTYSHFIDKDSVLKGKLDDNREALYGFEIDKSKTDAEVEADVFNYSFASKNTAYVFNFYNGKLGKNVLFMQTGNGEAHKSISLGCSTVEMYDMYGVKLADLHSDNGVFDFIIDELPVYVVGNFSDFTEKAYNPAVSPSSVKADGVSGDILDMQFTTRLKKNLKIEVSDGVEVVENNGFKNGKALLKVKVKAADAGTVQKFFVTIKDSTGKVYYSKEHSINITSPVEVSVVSNPASSVSDAFWQVQTTIKNMSNGTNISGSFTVTGPEKLAQKNMKRLFKNIEPGEEITFTSKLPEMVNKKVINFEGEIALDNGYKQTVTQSLNFTTAAYATKKPTIDGVMSPGEWIGDWIGADEQKDVLEIDDWGGPSDVSFNGNLMWDEDYFYFLGVGIDDVHFTSFEGAVSNMWQVDSFQIAFDDRAEINNVENNVFSELGICATPMNGDTIYRSKSLFREPAKILENAEVAIKRYDTYTLYECKVSWDDIFYEGYELDPDGPFRFSALLNDNDADSRGWIEYTSGIGMSKSAILFGDLKFVK